jgi:hypothetical protein
MSSQIGVSFSRAWIRAPLMNLSNTYYNSYRYLTYYFIIILRGHVMHLILVNVVVLNLNDLFININDFDKDINDV